MLPKRYFSKFIFTSLIALIICSCRNNNKESVVNFKTTKLPFTQAEILSPEAFNSKIEYILLENIPDNKFTQIDKIKIKNSNIYILDITGIHQLLVFTDKGKFLRRVGSRGVGEGKYLRLCDFDVDEKGNVYLYDSQNMHMLIYDPSGKLLAQKKTPFRADGFNLLRNGKYIFSVLKDSQNEDILADKIVTTDSTFNIESELFKYSNKFLDNKLTVGLFTENESGILYNKPINDSLFLFDHNGRIKQSYFLDFGSNTAPQELKNDYEKLAKIRNKHTYMYMYSVPMLIKDQIIGNIFSGGTKAMFIYNVGQNKAYIQKLTLTNLSHTNINLPLTTLKDSLIVSFLDLDLYEMDLAKEQLSNKIRDHIKNGGFVLTFHTLK